MAEIMLYKIWNIVFSKYKMTQMLAPEPLDQYWAYLYSFEFFIFHADSKYTLAEMNILILKTIFEKKKKKNRLKKW